MRLLRLSCLLLISACRGCDDEPTDDGDGTDLLRTARTTMYAEGGWVEVPVEVDSDTRSFLVTGVSDELLGLEEVTDPDGRRALYWEDWYDSPHWLTNAIFFWGEDVVFNWPIREEDGWLADGTWTVVLAALEERQGQYWYVDGAGVDLAVQTNLDADVADGLLAVRIVWAEGVGSQADVVAAVEGGVTRWEEIVAGVGLYLDVTYEDGTMDADLPYPIEGASDYQTASALGSGHDLMVVVGETIDGANDLYGSAGNIPGTIIPTRRSAVAISWLTNAGADGAYSDDDVRLLGETIAHETGHYLGLYHPVEATWDSWDALEDTVECDGAIECEDAMGDELMFAYPICGLRTCEPQGVVTGDQAGVMQRYTGVLE